MEVLEKDENVSRQMDRYMIVLSQFNGCWTYQEILQRAIVYGLMGKLIRMTALGRR